MSGERGHMDALDWLVRARVDILMILEEFDNDLLTPEDFEVLVSILACIDKMDRKAQAKSRNFFENIREEMS